MAETTTTGRWETAPTSLAARRWLPSRPQTLPEPLLNSSAVWLGLMTYWALADLLQGDRIVHLQGFGEAELVRARFGQVEGVGRAMTPQTPLLIGSLTKSFTAVAIMQLVEQGKVELDAPVQRYLSWFRVADPEASARITVRHLLTHTSGLPGRRETGILRQEDTGTEASERQVRALASVELTQPVGEAWQYASANYAVAGLIVEVVSGQPYEAYVQQHIFTPLQMRWSFTSPAAARGAGLADGHQYWFGQPVPAQLPYPRGPLPAGYLVSSAEDMSRYLLAHLNGGHTGEGRILSAEGVAELHRPGVVTAPLSDDVGAGGRPRGEIALPEHRHRESRRYVR